MPQIPTNIIDKEIDKLGELVTLTVKTAETYSDWGDETATTTDYSSIKAIFNVYGRQRSYNPEGPFTETSITFFFKSTQSYISIGTKITRANGEVYEIYDYRDHGAHGNTYVFEALVKKV